MNFESTYYRLDFFTMDEGYEGGYRLEDLPDTSYADLDMQTLAEWMELDLGEQDYRIEWWVTAVDDSGSTECEERFGFIIPIMGVNSDREGALPHEFILLPLYPNPFNSLTNIRFGLPSQSVVQITINDLYGREILHLSGRTYSPGYHSLTWDAAGFPAGMYLVRFEAGHIFQSQKVVLLK